MNILKYDWETAVKLANAVSENDTFNIIYTSADQIIELDTAFGMNDMSRLISAISGPVSVHLTGSMSLTDLVAVAPFRKFGPFTVSPHAILYCTGTVSGTARATIEEAELFDAYLQRRRNTMLDLLSTAYEVDRGQFEEWIDNNVTVTYNDLIGSGLFEEPSDV